MTAPRQTIPYDQALSLQRNIQRVRKHLGLSIKDICANAGVVYGNFSTYITSNFRPSGKLTPTTVKLKAYLDTLFDNGIPDDARTKDATGDLYTLYGCAKCRYRYKSLNHDGCYKFSLTKEQINRGAWVNTIKHGSFYLNEKSKCPYAA